MIAKMMMMMMTKTAAMAVQRISINMKQKENQKKQVVGDQINVHMKIQMTSLMRCHRRN